MRRLSFKSDTSLVPLLRRVGLHPDSPVVTVTSITSTRKLQVPNRRRALTSESALDNRRRNGLNP